MIVPTLWVDIYDKKSSDFHGQPKLSKTGRERVAVTRMIGAAQHTTVRTDSSASRGQADERVSDVVLLALPRTKINVGDVLAIPDGRRVVVTKMHERFTVFGQRDHHEVHCDAWIK